jgi:hypothetical protein
MEVVAYWFASTSEVHQSTLMLCGFIQLVAAIVVSRFLKRPEH